MDTKTVRLTFSDLWLKRADFIGLNTAELLCDVTAEVTRGLDGFTVRIEKVYAFGYVLNLAGLLKHETEERLEAWVLSYYLAVARSGLEGDAPEECA